MKTVFSNSMCAHVWAQCKQPHGRSGSMRFDGTKLYSYAEPIAHIVVAPSGHRVALFRACHFSVTTARHISYARRAVSGMPEFVVPEVFHLYHVTPDMQRGHTVNLSHLRGEFEEESARLLRVSVHSYAILGDHAAERLSTLADRVTYYARVFGIDNVIAPDWQAAADAATARRDRILNDPKRAEKRAAREAAKLAKEARDNAARAERDRFRIAEWRAHLGNHYRLSDADGRAMLRISSDGARVETSWGAECPIDDARRALALWERRTSGVHWVLAGGQPVKLGHFTLDSIDRYGTVKAGCHTIGAGELAALVRELAQRDLRRAAELQAPTVGV